MLQLPVEVDEAAAVKCWIRIWPPLEVSNSELEQRPLCKRKERIVNTMGTGDTLTNILISFFLPYILIKPFNLSIFLYFYLNEP